MVRQSGSAQRREDYEEVASRRNPYLVDYEEQRSRRSRAASCDSRADQGRRTGSDGRVRIQKLDCGENRTAPGRRPIAYGSRMAGSGRESSYDNRTAGDSRFAARAKEKQQSAGEWRISGTDDWAEHCPAGGTAYSEKIPRREVTTDMLHGYRNQETARKGKVVQVPIPAGESNRQRSGKRHTKAAYDRTPVRTGTGRQYGADRKALTQRTLRRPEVPEYSRRTAGRPSARQPKEMPLRRRTATAVPDRKERLFKVRLLLGAWVLCIFLFAGYFALKNQQTNTGKENILPVGGEPTESQKQPSPGTLVQGIPADAFAKHPDWTEDFLTPNEYSRPGEPLESVKNIFVHYTANPGTSAAQNRSYFEWQKDTHEASVSSHFIIGYEGEIIQCVPLNEIAYAVMTRNYDSVSIECCYLAEDGSFTQETYDSLISLLAWLTDIYDLDTEDILRHYDCGGKKCPLYYTEHEDAWEQLKKDVDKL